MTLPLAPVSCCADGDPHSVESTHLWLQGRTDTTIDRMIAAGETDGFSGLSHQCAVIDLLGGRRAICMVMGSLHIRVVEVPAHSISREEWAMVQMARQSYVGMWGGKEFANSIEEDEMDGRVPGTPWETHHYLASASTTDGRQKLLTMRRVAFTARVDDASEYPIDSLPDDIRFWRLRTVTTGGQVPLWHALRAHLHRSRPTGTRQTQWMRIACLGRSATYPLGHDGWTRIERDGTPMCFAAVQMLVTEGHRDHLYVGQICSEFQEQALSLLDGQGSKVMPNFQRTTHTLGLPPDVKIELDNDRPYVRAHKVRFPGYWIENDGAFQVFRSLMDTGKLVPEDIAEPWHDLVAEWSVEGRLQPPTSYDPVVRLQFLTRPRALKYLAPLINTQGMVNGVLSGHEVRQRLVYEAGDGPFSSTIPPNVWRRSALAVLLAAHEKHNGTAHPKGGETV